jgi:hypothetical protein
MKRNTATAINLDQLSPIAEMSLEEEADNVVIPPPRRWLPNLWRTTPIVYEVSSAAADTPPAVGQNPPAEENSGVSRRDGAPVKPEEAEKDIGGFLPPPSPPPSYQLHPDLRLVTVDELECRECKRGYDRRQVFRIRMLILGSIAC